MSLFKHLFSPPLKVKIKIRDKLYDVDKKLYKKGINQVTLFRDGKDYVEYWEYHDTYNDPTYWIVLNGETNYLTEDEAFELIAECKGE